MERKENRSDVFLLFLLRFQEDQQEEVLMEEGKLKQEVFQGFHEPMSSAE